MKRSKDIKIKVCGITCRRNFKSFNDFPINFIGLNFIERSKRKIKVEKAKKILKITPKNIFPVLIFENEPLEKVFKISQLLNVKNIQLHGTEDIEYCKVLKKKGFKIIKALPANLNTLKRLISYSKVCDYFLVDSQNSQKEMGGTGKVTNWKIAKKIVEKAKKIKVKVFLAGGLNPKNIKSAIQQVNPYGIDVNSGIEKNPGKKDKKKLQDLIDNL